MVWLGDFVYHEECTSGPALTIPYTQRCFGRLTEERVRQIVREELAALPPTQRKPTT
jgi:hypothetical protein